MVAPALAQAGTALVVPSWVQVALAQAGTALVVPSWVVPAFSAQPGTALVVPSWAVPSQGVPVSDCRVPDSAWVVPAVSALVVPDWGEPAVSALVVPAWAVVPARGVSASARVASARGVFVADVDVA